jgi:hypothetical protein
MRWLCTVAPSKRAPSSRAPTNVAASMAEPAKLVSVLDLNPTLYGDDVQVDDDRSFDRAVLDELEVLGRAIGAPDGCLTHVVPLDVAFVLPFADELRWSHGQPGAARTSRR